MRFSCVPARSAGITLVPDGRRGASAGRHAKRYRICCRIPLIGLTLGTLAGASSAVAAEPAAPELLTLEGDISPVQISTMVWEDGWPRVGRLE
jgi:hypothetical protein